MIYLSFNGTDLSQLTGVMIDHINKDTWPSRVVQQAKLARFDGRSFVDATFDYREIIVTGRIIAADQPTFESNRSSFMQYLTPQNATLDLNIGTSIVRFYATVTELMFSDTGGGYGAFTIKFGCSNPIGIDSNLLFGLVATTITAATSTQNLSTIGGNYFTNAVVNVYINAVSGGSSKTVTITNPSTSKAIEITRTWAAGERLVIDGRDKTVKVNGTLVPYSGDFPTWEPGLGGTIKYTDTFTTSRNISLSMQYNKRYL